MEPIGRTKEPRAVLAPVTEGLPKMARDTIALGERPATMKATREDPRYGSLPIIAITAKAPKEDRERCIAAGATDYLAKPLRSGSWKRCSGCGSRHDAQDAQG